MRTERIIDIASWCGLYDQDIKKLVSKYKGFAALEALTTVYKVPEEEVAWAIDQSFKFFKK